MIEWRKYQKQNYEFNRVHSIKGSKPPYKESGCWCVDLRYDSWGNIADGTVYALIKEEMDKVTIGYVFQA